MRKFGSITFVFWLVLYLSSCLQDNLVTPEDPIFRESILRYLDQLNATNSNDDDHKITELINAIDYRTVKSYKLNESETLLIADIKELSGAKKEETLKAIFFIIQDEIVRSNIVSFSDFSNDYNNLIVSILKQTFDPKQYSGKFSFYSVFQVIQFYNLIDNGNLIEGGILNRNRNTTNERAKACIDWYLVTTYYYSDGGRRTTDQYLFTTCDDNECNTTRVSGRIKCGGGGETPGSGNPVFPYNPQDGDEYEFTDRDGIKTLYKFDAQLNMWTIHLRTLSELIVQSQPQNYPYLLTDGPTHGLMVLGPDDFLYTFDSYSGSWIGGPVVVVDSPDRPIANMADYLECFDVNQSATITIYVNQPKPNSNDAYRVTWSGGLPSAIVGHTFVSITQGNNVSVFGFYPNGDPNPTNPSMQSVMGDDSGDPYHVSISATVSGSVLQQIINYSINFNGTYDLNSFNCSDFGIEVGNIAGMNLPDAYGSWMGGGGSNPGALGQHIRSITPSGNITRNTTGGTAPQNNKGC